MEGEAATSVGEPGGGGSGWVHTSPLRRVGRRSREGFCGQETDALFPPPESWPERIVRERGGIRWTLGIYLGIERRILAAQEGACQAPAKA